MTESKYENVQIKKFAEKHAGEEVYILDRTNKVQATARLIGFYVEPSDPSSALLLVDFPYDKERQKGCWQLKDYKDNVHLTLEGVQKGFVVDYDKIKLIVRPIPYPNICGICKAPARINDAMKICSNLQCKRNKQYMRTLIK